LLNEKKKKQSEDDRWLIQLRIGQSVVAVVVQGGKSVVVVALSRSGSEEKGLAHNTVGIITQRPRLHLPTLSTFPFPLPDDIFHIFSFSLRPDSYILISFLVSWWVPFFAFLFLLLYFLCHSRLPARTKS
jgi:hypothetical protein